MAGEQSRQPNNWFVPVFVENQRHERIVPDSLEHVHAIFVALAAIAVEYAEEFPGRLFPVYELEQPKKE